MRRKITLWLAVLAALFLVVLAVVLTAAKRAGYFGRWLKPLVCKPSPTWNYPPPAAARTINFPDDEEVGILYTAMGPQSYGYDGYWEKTYGPARGQVELAEGEAVCLQIKQGFSSVLSTLEPNSIQAIDFSAPIEIPFELYEQNQTKRIVELSDEELKPLENWKSLYQLVLHNTTITDKSLSYISQVKTLRLINLWNTRITDEGLAYLTQLPSLDTIYLGATDITDAGLEHLGKLTRLRGLSLTGSNRQKGKNIATATSVNLKITDAGMQHLGALTSLEYLHVADTGITDESIGILTQLRSLRILDISGTRITEEAISKLEAALPDCKVINDPGISGR